jgi:hypothetical protein
VATVAGGDPGSAVEVGTLVHDGDDWVSSRFVVTRRGRGVRFTGDPDARGRRSGFTVIPGQAEDSQRRRTLIPFLLTSRVITAGLPARLTDHRPNALTGQSLPDGMYRPDKAVLVARDLQLRGRHAEAADVLNHPPG